MTLSVLFSFAGAAVALAQSPGWSARSPGVLPAKAGTLATDVARGVIVSFGANPHGQSLPETWEWGGTVWTLRPGSPAPPQRLGAQLVHDPSRRRTVLFGGSVPGSTALRGDTWEWDGTVWSQRTLPTSPSARERYGIAFDAARSRIVLYGGDVVGGVDSAETWEYDGLTWGLRTPPNSPGPRSWNQLAHDTARQRTVMFGGYPATQNDIWEWDGATWHFAAVAGSAPAARTDHALLYDAVRQRTVMVGGALLNGAGSHSQETWEWNGTVWQLRAGGIPFPSVDVPTATDPTTGAALAFHGGTVSRTVWRWNGSSWVASITTRLPPVNGVSSHACTDTARHRVVLLEWPTAAQPIPATFEWDGNTWSRVAVAGPATAAAGALAFDSARGRTVLVGGDNLTMQTWEWDGVVWILRTPATSPLPARAFFPSSFDGARQRVVLFGGQWWPGTYPGPSYLADTWTYDGVSWTRHFPATAPSYRAAHAMAYDPTRQRVVLFGGWHGNVVLDDTWEWDGTNWTAMAPVSRPAARMDHAMAFDPQQNAVVLFGGTRPPWDQAFGDTWSWDGNTWSAIATGLAPAARRAHVMTLDPGGSGVLLHGGAVHVSALWGWEVVRDTWIFTPAPATATTLGTPCAAGVPPRLASSRPHLGNTDFGFEIRDTAAGAPCLLGMSFTTQAQPLGPCTLHLQAGVASVFTLASAYGVARVPLALPYAAWLRGVSVTAQAAVLASPGAWSGIDFTAALTIVIGD